MTAPTTSHPSPSDPPPPDASTVRAMLQMLGISVAADDPRLPVLVQEMGSQVQFAHAIDAILADVPAEAVATAVDTFDPAWPAARKDAS